MPFESEAQRRYLYANEPEVAEEFEEKTPKGKRLPKYKKKRTVSDEFIRQIDTAFGLIEEQKEQKEDDFIVFESNSDDPQSTNKPKLGPNKGPRKGSPAKKHDPEDDSM